MGARGENIHDTVRDRDERSPRGEKALIYGWYQWLAEDHCRGSNRLSDNGTLLWMSEYCSRSRRLPSTSCSTSAAIQPFPLRTYWLKRISERPRLDGSIIRTKTSRSLSIQNCFEVVSPCAAPTTYAGRPCQADSCSLLRSKPRRT